MIFAKIDFINLLPFFIFLKKYISSTQTKQIINYKKSYPANINIKFKKRTIDAAFISSISSRKCKCLDIGIVSNGEVLSVLSINGQYKKDYQSDTSNALAKVLDINGEILIGDKALFYYHNSENRDFVDLSKAWQDKYNMPFVFARLCVNKNEKIIQKLSKQFLKSNVKIPSYVLNEYAKKTNLSKKQIKDYLQKISYKIGHKEKRSLKLFLKLSKNKGL